MEYKDLIDLFFERSNALQTFWTIYVTVVGALLAFCATRDRLGLWTMALITITFLLFAAVNLAAMRDVTEQRLRIATAIKQFKPRSTEDQSLNAIRDLLEPTLKPPTFAEVLSTHLVSDGLTLSALWIISYRKQKRHATNVA